MDGKRFDSLTRSLASGSSRRAVLKSLLGLGAVAGATLTRHESDARTIGARPTVPPPQPPPPTTTTTKSPTTTTPDPCTGYRCGLECCDSQVQCCDKECCPAGSICVGEEFCCPSDLACGTTCCDSGQSCCAIEGCCSGRCYGEGRCCADGIICTAPSGLQQCCDTGNPSCCLPTTTLPPTSTTQGPTSTTQRPTTTTHVPCVGLPCGNSCCDDPLSVCCGGRCVTGLCCGEGARCPGPCCRDLTCVSGFCESCGNDGTSCMVPEDCCNRICDKPPTSSTGVCNLCHHYGGGICDATEDCCFGDCTNGQCTSCTRIGATCRGDDECCSGICDEFGAQPRLCLPCRPGGHDCTSNAECCSDNPYCDKLRPTDAEGVCNICLNYGGAPCLMPSDCCRGDCQNFQCTACFRTGFRCQRNDDCCSGNCSGSFSNPGNCVP